MLIDVMASPRGQARRALRRGLCGPVVVAASLVPSAICARGQTDQTLLLKPWDGPGPVELEAAFRWTPDSAPRGSSGNSSASEYASKGRVRLDDQHELNPALGYDTFGLSLHDSLGRVPSSLTDSSVAFATPITKIDEWFVGVGAGFGYAGDRGLANSESWYGKGSVTAGRKFEGGGALAVWIEYDGNHALFPDVPVPGIAYADSLSDSIDYVLGLPDSSISWRPNDTLELSAEWAVPFTIDASIEQKIGGGFSIVASFLDRTHQFHAERLRNIDRLMFTERRVEIGLFWKPDARVKVGASVGYAFDRSIDSGFDDRDTDHVLGLPDRPMFSVEATIAF